MAESDPMGHVAWVSGAGSGIGEAAARHLATGGAAVALVDLHVERCQAVAESIRADGGRAIAVACDVGQSESVEASIRQTVDAFGSLDWVVNNAGIVLVKPLHQTTDEEWSRVMDVNVKSMYLSLVHALPHLRRAGRSSIVNVGSISSFVGQAGTPVYTASKHAVLGLTRSIALDYAADGIRCNCVCPGITDTPMLREHLDATGDPEGVLAQRLRRVASGKAIQPAQVAASIGYLLSDESAGVTGTSLTIDGGYLAAAEWDSGSS